MNSGITKMAKIATPLSRYYYQPVKPNEEELTLTTLIKQLSEESENCYGKRRIQVDLNELGYQLGLCRIATLMSKANIVAIRPKQRHYYPDSGVEHKYAPNLLKRELSPTTRILIGLAILLT